MLDGSEELNEEDRFIASHLDPSKTVCIINKSDKEQKVTEDDVRALAGDIPVTATSLISESGTETVEKIIKDRVYSGETSQEESVTVTNARHEQLLKEADRSVGDALVLVSQKEPVEIIEIDVNQAYESLGEIIGEAVEDDIIDEVFSRFCLGK